MARSLAQSLPRQAKRRSRAIRRIKVGLSLFVAALFLVFSATVFYAKGKLDEAAALIPNLPDKMRSLSGEPTAILSSDGKVLETMATEFRRPVSIKDVPEQVIHATLAAEDKRFYEHGGVDFWAMGRSLLTTLSGRRVEGASTLAMQLSKRLYTSSEKSVERKVKDMALATMIERKLTKDQILEIYLNQVFYGSGAYGVSAAAEVYFGKRLDQVTIAEAALLARCVRRPSEENPFTDPKAAIRNRDVVLGIMHEQRWISDKAYRNALSEPLRLRKDKKDAAERRAAPYFCDYVKSLLKEFLPDIDISKGGYRIETTLDSRLQRYAEEQVRDMVRENRGLRITTSAFVLLDKEGRILAMVGGPDYGRNQFNVITQGRRQPGSSFKPLVYATAFEYGVLSPYGSVSNEPFYIHDKGERRKIRGGGHGGEVSVLSAIAQSINTPAMWAGKMVGVDNVIRAAHQIFGIESELTHAQTIALGADEVTPLEMAQAYSVFQGGGDRFTPFGVKSVVGPDGTVLRAWGPEIHPRALSPEAAAGMDRCLRAVVEEGTAQRASRVKNARGKTGTTSDNKDAWFCGYTDKYVGVGWVANETRDRRGRVRYQPMDEYVMGGHMVAPMWAKIVGKAQELYGEQEKARSDESDRPRPHNKAEPAEENAGLTEPDSVPETTPDPGAAPTHEAPGDPNAGQAVPDRNPPEAKSERPPDAKAESPPDEQNIVFVEICADSGQRATVYCPERVRKAFRAGHEPKGRCRLHHGPGG